MTIRCVRDIYLSHYLMTGQTYVEQLLHQIVELLCATGNNGHSAQVYIYFLIMCLLYIFELFTSNYLTMHGIF